MYRCQNCEAQVVANAKALVVNSGVRPRRYPPQPIPRKRGKAGRRKKVRYGAEGFGWEPIEQMKVCTHCYPELQAEFEAELDAVLNTDTGTVTEQEYYAAAAK